MIIFLRKVNDWYNVYCEQKIATSVFAAGGIKAYFVRRKLKQWLAKTTGILLDVGSGDTKWKKYIEQSHHYITLDYIPAAHLYPWRKCTPDINGDGLTLPLKAQSIDTVLNVCVLEHVHDPHQLIREISRVLKPGGKFLLVGPGDITYSHGDPSMFFNMTQYAYKILLEKNHFTIIEEYFPSKTFVSIAHILYMRLVRNKVYNTSSLLKCFQLIIFLLSLLISPFINVIGLLMDYIIPFDGRGYDLYMVLSQKAD